MLPDEAAGPESIKTQMRTLMLDEIKNQSSLDVFELELFEWYVKETEVLIGKVLEDERNYVREQMECDPEQINDSGIVAAEYYLKRVRYSHVIYLASILETFLERECGRITAAVDEMNIPFALKELNGDQWSKKRKYIERYGRIDVSASAWKKADELIALRNHLVHDNGSLSELGDQEKRRFTKSPGINFDQTQIIVEFEFIRYAFEAVKELCSDIDEKVSGAISRIGQKQTSR